MEIAVSTSPAHIMMTRRKNTWYSVRDGNWSDPNVWMSNALNKGDITCPQVGDDVYIGHSIIFDTAIGLTTVINNLSISGKLTSLNNNSSLTINGNLQATGYIDFTGAVVTLNLYGVVNLILYDHFIAGNSTINYGSIFDQPILDLAYNNLHTSGILGAKYLTANTIIGGMLNALSNFECGAYDLTVKGTSLIGTVGSYIFSKNSSMGSLLFIGYVDFEGGTDLSGGNPNIEFRGGLMIHTFKFVSGTGTFTFTTNDQNIDCSAYLGGSWNAPIIISGAIAITLTSSGIFQTNSTINGTISSSTFNNNGILWLGFNHTPMITGIFNYQFGANSTLGYVFSGNYSLPYSTYANLYIGGVGGTKSLSDATIINKTLVIGSVLTSGAVFDCAGFDMDVKDTFTCFNNFRASSFSNIIFEGMTIFTNGQSVSDGVDLRIGNPNIEFRGGLTIHTNYTYTGTGLFKFTNKSQMFDLSVNNGGALACNWLISGAITVTYFDGVGFGSVINGTFNGDNVSSILDNRGTFNYQNSTAPMSVGKLYCNQALNTFIYGLTGNQEIMAPSDQISPGYRNLILQGSGAKKLLGNISVKGTYILTSPATLNNNGFTLTNP